MCPYLATVVFILPYILFSLAHSLKLLELLLVLPSATSNVVAASWRRSPPEEQHARGDLSLNTTAAHSHDLYVATAQETQLE